MFSKLTQRQRIKAGHKYEYYISWMLRNQGFEVEPRTKYKYYDRGIDLTATKGGRTCYIQCKGWSKHRQLHEDVIDHFYGSVAYAAGPENMKDVELWIYSSAEPTAYARDHAAKLNIQLYHEPFRIWKRKRYYRSYSTK